MALVTDTQEPLHPLSVEDYLRMVEVGILTDEHHVELLEGAVIEMSPEGSPHASLLSRLIKYVVRPLDDALIVRVNGPLIVPPASVPQPDIAVVDVEDSTPEDHPCRAHLAIEVSYSSLRKDLVRKARIYAAAGIREYWVVDLKARLVHVHLNPREGGYAIRHEVAPPAPLVPTHVSLPPLELTELFEGY